MKRLHDRRTAHARLAWIVPATHVCGHWRAVAIAYSCFWTDINTDLGREWALEMMHRARLVPVNVRLDDVAWPPLSDYAVEHIDRVRELWFKGSRQILMPILERLSNPAMALETIQFEITWPDRERYPSDLIARAVGHLRHVELNNCSISWDHPTFAPKMVSLKLSFAGGWRMDEAARLTCARLLATLENMPALETLHLIHTLPRAADFTDISRIVALPLLKELQLTGLVADCCWLARSLALPATASVEISSYSHDLSDGCQRLIPVFVACVAALTATHPIGYLDIAYYSRALAFTAVPFPRTCIEELCPPSQLRIVIDLMFANDAVFSALFEAVCAAIPLDRVNKLVVDTSPDHWFQPRHWQETLRSANRVETLGVIGEQPTRHLVHLFGMEASMEPPSDGEESLLFPALNSLDFFGIDIHHQGTPEAPSLAHTISKSLKYRAAKAPLQTLHLHDCQARMEWAEDLRNFVPTEITATLVYPCHSLFVR